MDAKSNPIKNSEKIEDNSITRPLTKSGMKKFLRFIILANHRMRKNNKPLLPSKPSFKYIKEEIGTLKTRLKEKNVNKVNVVNNKNNPVKKKSNNHNSKSISSKEEKTVLSKGLLEKIDKFGKKNLKNYSKTKKNEEKKVVDPEFEKRSREILDIKSVIFELEKKHKEIVERDEHHPILLKRLEEKINFLKKRISDIEDGI